jgi:N-succinyldiaminopimelate aminotransferase
MVLPVNGTREGLFSFVQSTIDARRGTPVVAMPNPFYQIYEGAALLAGAQCRYLSCDDEHSYLPDLDAVAASDWDACQLLFLCSPGNPRARSCRNRTCAAHWSWPTPRFRDCCGRVLRGDSTWAAMRQRGCCRRPGPPATANSNAASYSTVSRNASSVPGLRSGFVAGDPRLLTAFRSYRTYHGCAMPLHTQLASIPAWSDEAHVEQNRLLYRQKFAAVVPILADTLDVTTPPGASTCGPASAMTKPTHADCTRSRTVTVLPGSYLARTIDGRNPGRAACESRWSRASTTASKQRNEYVAIPWGPRDE